MCWIPLLYFICCVLLTIALSPLLMKLGNYYKRFDEEEVIAIFFMLMFGLTGYVLTYFLDMSIGIAVTFQVITLLGYLALRVGNTPIEACVTLLILLSLLIALIPAAQKIREAVKKHQQQSNDQKESKGE